MLYVHLIHTIIWGQEVELVIFNLRGQDCNYKNRDLCKLKTRLLTCDIFYSSKIFGTSHSLMTGDSHEDLSLNCIYEVYVIQIYVHEIKSTTQRIVSMTQLSLKLKATYGASADSAFG